MDPTSHMSIGEWNYAYHQVEDLRQASGGAMRRMSHGASQLHPICDMRLLS